MIVESEKILYLPGSPEICQDGIAVPAAADLWRSKASSRVDEGDGWVDA